MTWVHCPYCIFYANPFLPGSSRDTNSRTLLYPNNSVLWPANKKKKKTKDLCCRKNIKFYWIWKVAKEMEKKKYIQESNANENKRMEMQIEVDLICVFCSFCGTTKISTMRKAYTIEKWPDSIYAMVPRIFATWFYVYECSPVVNLCWIKHKWTNRML